MFINKERKLLSDPYFRIIREEEQFVELQSINTGHCWNVFKNQFEREYKVTLYHKHSISDKYYHQQKKCRNVSRALEEIERQGKGTRGEYYKKYYEEHREEKMEKVRKYRMEHSEEIKERRRQRKELERQRRADNEEN